MSWRLVTQALGRASKVNLGLVALNYSLFGGAAKDGGSDVLVSVPHTPPLLEKALILVQ